MNSIHYNMQDPIAPNRKETPIQGHAFVSSIWQMVEVGDVDDISKDCVGRQYIYRHCEQRTLLVACDDITLLAQAEPCYPHGLNTVLPAHAGSNCHTASAD
ncbi:unnamed protein product [Somion occarium]|uniref:Uncharacterized protein n=1 Tax=Somion occarium TaxID=3059160 RepID=A0ABP1DPE1_9APHY